MIKKYFAALLFFYICILRSSQSETFKKGHTNNTGVFYKKRKLFPNECSIHKVSRFWVKKWINLDFNQKLQKILIFNVVYLFYLYKYRPKILGTCFFFIKAKSKRNLSEFKILSCWHHLKYPICILARNLLFKYKYKIYTHVLRMYWHFVLGVQEFKGGYQLFSHMYFGAKSFIYSLYMYASGASPPARSAHEPPILVIP